MREREFIGQGRGHTVFCSKQNERVVLKKPRLATQLFQFIPYFLGDNLDNELQEAKASIQNTTVEIPKTRIFSFKNGYIIAQQYIISDESVDLNSFFNRINNDKLSFLYFLNPTNFISSEGIVYWIDPFFNPLVRTLNRYYIISYKISLLYIDRFFKEISYLGKLLHR